MYDILRTVPSSAEESYKSSNVVGSLPNIRLSVQIKAPIDLVFDFT